MASEFEIKPKTSTTELLTLPDETQTHRNLEQLQRYLEVTDEQVLGAAASLAMLSPVARSGVEQIQIKS